MERIGGDSHLLELMDEVTRDCSIAANVIEDDPDIDAFFCFFFKDLKGLLVPFAFRDDEEL